MNGNMKGNLDLRSDLEILEEERYYVSAGMRYNAGSFFKAIGEAISHAHPSNLKMIKKLWPKEWDRYYKIGKKEKLICPLCKKDIYAARLGGEFCECGKMDYVDEIERLRGN